MAAPTTSSNAAPPTASARARVDRASAAELALLAAVALAAAVVAALAAALLTGATDPVRLGDPGPLVRWGTPVVRVVHDLSAATTIGLLFLAAFVVPEGATSHRRYTAGRLAALTGALWALTCGVQVVLAFALALGAPVGSPGFWGTLGRSGWDLDLTRCLGLTGMVAAGAALVSALVRTRVGYAWAAILGLLALLPLALTGHAGGTVNHDAAVNTLAFHLVGATLWVGGLIALLVLRPALGPALEVTARRYSTVAAWGFGLVALSGVVNAAVRLGSFSALGTRYGLVVLAKAGILLALGAAGWWQRRRLLGRVGTEPGAFARLATLEVVLMAVATGLAVALSRTAPPVPEVPPAQPDPVLAITGYPAPPRPTLETFFTQWQLEWLFTTVAWGGILLYLVGVVALRRRGDRWPVERTIAWVLGMLAFFYATDGAPGVYGRVMFSLHMLMHMGLMMIIPILLVMGMPTTLVIRALHPRTDRTLGPRELLLGLLHSRYFAFWANPVVAALNFYLSLVIFYWSPLFELALRTHTGHVLMVIHFTLAGYLFVWTLVGRDPGPAKWPAPMRLMILIGTLAAHAFFGVAMMMGTRLLAEGTFRDLGYVHDLLADQRLAGTITWGIGEFPTMVLAILVGIDWIRSDDRETRRRDRQADRDDDAELRAYNERLAAIAARDAGTRS